MSYSPQLRKARKKTRKFLQKKGTVSPDSAVEIPEGKWTELYLYFLSRT